MSPTLPPSRAAPMPRHIDSSVTCMRACTSSGTSPRATLIAASPCQPSTMAPQSIETRSPSASTRSPGIPCTTSSFTETQIEPVNPW